MITYAEVCDRVNMIVDNCEFKPDDKQLEQLRDLYLNEYCYAYCHSMFKEIKTGGSSLHVGGIMADTLAEADNMLENITTLLKEGRLEILEGEY